MISKIRHSLWIHNKKFVYIATTQFRWRYEECSAHCNAQSARLQQRLYYSNTLMCASPLDSTELNLKADTYQVSDVLNKVLQLFCFVCFFFIIIMWLFLAWTKSTEQNSVTTMKNVTFWSATSALTYGWLLRSISSFLFPPLFLVEWPWICLNHSGPPQDADQTAHEQHSNGPSIEGCSKQAPAVVANSTHVVNHLCNFAEHQRNWSRSQEDVSERKEIQKFLAFCLWTDARVRTLTRCCCQGNKNFHPNLQLFFQVFYCLNLWSWKLWRYFERSVSFPLLFARDFVRPWMWWSRRWSTWWVAAIGKCPWKAWGQAKVVASLLLMLKVGADASVPKGT